MYFVKENWVIGSLIHGSGPKRKGLVEIWDKMQNWQTPILSSVVKGVNDEMEKGKFKEAFFMSTLKMKAHFASIYRSTI